MPPRHRLQLAWRKAKSSKLVWEPPDRELGPGETYNRAFTDSFFLSLAVSCPARSSEGPEADYWRMVERGVPEPIGARQWELALGYRHS